MLIERNARDLNDLVVSRQHSSGLKVQRTEYVAVHVEQAHSVSLRTKHESSL